MLPKWLLATGLRSDHLLAARETIMSGGTLTAVSDTMAMAGSRDAWVAKNWINGKYVLTDMIAGACLFRSSVMPLGKRKLAQRVAAAASKRVRTVRRTWKKKTEDEQWVAARLDQPGTLEKWHGLIAEVHGLESKPATRLERHRLLRKMGIWRDIEAQASPTAEPYDGPEHGVTPDVELAFIDQVLTGLYRPVHYGGVEPVSAWADIYVPPEAMIMSLAGQSVGWKQGRPVRAHVLADAILVAGAVHGFELPDYGQQELRDMYAQVQSSALVKCKVQVLTVDEFVRTLQVVSEKIVFNPELLGNSLWCAALAAIKMLLPVQIGHDNLHLVSDEAARLIRTVPAACEGYEDRLVEAAKVIFPDVFTDQVDGLARVRPEDPESPTLVEERCNQLRLLAETQRRGGWCGQHHAATLSQLRVPALLTYFCYLSGVPFSMLAGNYRHLGFTSAAAWRQHVLLNEEAVQTALREQLHEHEVAADAIQRFHQAVEQVRDHVDFDGQAPGNIIDIIREMAGGLEDEPDPDMPDLVDGNVEAQGFGNFISGAGDAVRSGFISIIKEVMFGKESVDHYRRLCWQNRLLGGLEVMYALIAKDYSHLVSGIGHITLASVDMATAGTTVVETIGDIFTRFYDWWANGKSFTDPDFPREPNVEVYEGGRIIAAYRMPFGSLKTLQHYTREASKSPAAVDPLATEDVCLYVKPLADGNTRHLLEGRNVYVSRVTMAQAELGENALIHPDTLPFIIGLNSLFSLYENLHQPEAQAGFEFAPMSLLVRCVGTVFGMNDFLTGDLVHDITIAAKTLVLMNVTKTAGVSILAWLKATVSAFCLLVFRTDPFCVENTKCTQAMVVLEEKMLSFMREGEPAGSTRADQYLDLEEDARGIFLYAQSLKTLPANVSVAYSRVYFDFVKWHDTARHNASSVPERVRPVSIFLHGPSHTGKTPTLNWLCETLPQVLYGVPYKPNMRFNYPTDVKGNWDGYMSWDAEKREGVLIVPADDKLTIKSKELREAYVADVFGIVNTGRHLVPMATLESKGRVHFTSEVFIQTCNNVGINNLPIETGRDDRRPGTSNQPTGFGNRIDLLITCPPNDYPVDFCDKTFWVHGGAYQKFLRSVFTEAPTAPLRTGFDQDVPNTGTALVLNGRQLLAGIKFVHQDLVRRRNQMRAPPPVALRIAQQVGDIVRDFTHRAEFAAQDMDNSDAADVVEGRVLLPGGGAVAVAAPLDVLNPIEEDTEAQFGRVVNVVNPTSILAKYAEEPVTWKEWLAGKGRRTLALIADHPFACLAISAVVAGCAAAWIFREPIMDAVLPERKTEPQSRTLVVRTAKHGKIYRRPHTVSAVEAQVSFVQGHTQDCVLARVSSLMKACGELHMRHEGMETQVRTFLLGPYVAACVGHTFEAMDGLEDSAMALVMPKGREEPEPTLYWHEPNAIMRCADKDLALIEFPPSVGKRASIYKALLPRSKGEVKENEAIYIMKVDVATSAVLVTKAMVMTKSPVPYAASQREGAPMIKPKESLTYAMETTKGDCGNLILVVRDGAAYVCGYHVAGNKRNPIGHGALLYKEDVDTYMEELQPAASAEPPVLPIEGEVEAQNYPIKLLPPKEGETYNGFPVVAHLPPGHLASMNTKSKIRASPWKDALGPSTMQPAQVVSVDGKTAHEHAQRKYPRKMHIATCPAWPQIRAELLRRYPPRQPSRVYTEEEVIMGVDGEIPSINWQTSVGWPLNTMGPSKKSHWIKVFAEASRPSDPHKRYEMHPLLRQLIDYREANYARGLRSFTPFLDSFKDEIRKNGKEQSPRLFCAPGLDFLISAKRRLVDFFQYVHSKCVNGSIKVGINVHGNDWGALAEEYLDFMCLDDDLEGFDKRLPALVIQLGIEFINMWYDDSVENQTTRMLILLEMIDPHHVAGDVVFTTLGEMPSGMFGTAELNSLLNLIMLLQCFWDIVVKYDLPLELKDLITVIYGDDNLNRTRDELLSSPFPWDEFADLMYYRWGMVMTDTDKLSRIKAKSLEWCSFISRGFVWRDGYCHAPLSLSRVCEILYWTRDFEQTTLQATINSFCVELTHHPKKEYERLRKLLMYHPFTVARQLHVMSFEEAWVQRFGMHQPCNPGWTVESQTAEPVLVGDVPVFVCDTEAQSAPMTSGNVNAGGTDGPVMETRETGEAPVTDQAELIAFHDTTLMDHERIGSAAAVDLPASFFPATGMLDRTYPLAKGTWTTSQTTGTLLATISLPEQLLAVEQIERLVAPYSLLQTKYRITVRINALRTYFGMLMIYAVPWGGEDDLTADIYTNTGWPHVLVSPSDSTAAQLDLDFIWPFKAYRMRDTYYSTPAPMWTIKLKVFNRLQLITSEPGSDVTWTVFGAFVEPKLFAPNGGFQLSVQPLADASQDVEAQSGVLEAAKMSGRPSMARGVRSVRTTPRAGVQDWKAPIIRLAMAGIEAFREAAEAGLGGPVAQGLAIAARAYGLDKPSDQAVHQRVLLDFAPGTEHTSEVDPSTSLTHRQDNAVANVPAHSSRGAIDEMDLRYIASVPMLVGQWEFGVTTTEPLLIPTNPFYTLGMNPSTRAVTLPYVGEVASRFMYWRGGLKYMFIINACAFMSGRLRIRWVPGMTWNQVDNYLSTLPFPTDLPAMVVDINQQVTVKFTIPFLTDQWWQASYPAAGGQTLDNMQYNTPTGVLVFDWENPLVVPDATHDPHIIINCYVAGASDFEVAVPFSTAGTQPSTGVHADVEAQCSPVREFNTDFPGLHPSFGGVSESGVTMGEKNHSVREYLHHYFNVATVTPQGSWFEFHRDLVSGGPGLNVVNAGWSNTKADALSSWTQLFQFWRGSLRYRVETDHGGTPFYLFARNPGLYTYFSSARPIVPVEPNLQNSKCVTTPYLHPVSFRTTVASNPFGSMPAGYAVQSFMGVGVMSPTISFSTDPALPRRFRIFVSVGDDFSFSFLRPARRHDLKMASDEFYATVSAFPQLMAAA